MSSNSKFWEQDQIESVSSNEQNIEYSDTEKRICLYHS